MNNEETSAISDCGFWPTVQGTCEITASESRSRSDRVFAPIIEGAVAAGFWKSAGLIIVLVGAVYLLFKAVPAAYRWFWKEVAPALPSISDEALERHQDRIATLENLAELDGYKKNRLKNEKANAREKKKNPKATATFSDGDYLPPMPWAKIAEDED